MKWSSVIVAGLIVMCAAFFGREAGHGHRIYGAVVVERLAIKP
jgi:hypothetical protein